MSGHSGHAATSSKFCLRFSFYFPRVGPSSVLNVSHLPPGARNTWLDFENLKFGFLINGSATNADTQLA